MTSIYCRAEQKMASTSEPELQTHLTSSQLPIYDADGPDGPVAPGQTNSADGTAQEGHVGQTGENPVEAYIRAADSAMDTLLDIITECRQTYAAAHPEDKDGAAENKFPPNYEEEKVMAYLVKQYPELHRGLPLVLAAMVNGQYDSGVLREFLTKFGPLLMTETDEVKASGLHAEYVIMLETHYGLYKCARDRKDRKELLVKGLLEERAHYREIAKRYSEEMTMHREILRRETKKRIIEMVKKQKDGSA